MNLRDSLKKILMEWNEEKKKPFKNNILAEFIRHDFVNSVKIVTEKNKSNYLLKASPGAGNWANIPWLSILDPRITTTTQEGIYPVYLFRSDCKGVYLSLNQGTTNPINKFGRIVAAEKARNVSDFLHSKIDGFLKWEKDTLDLAANTSLGKSYEKPNIGFKYYAIDSIPSNEKVVNDLNELLEIYNCVFDYWPEIKQKQFSIKKNMEIHKAPIIDKINTDNLSIIDFVKILKLANLFVPYLYSYRFISSLLSKPFLILTGLSGSGKTKLAEAFSKWISGDNQQICMVAVGADWTNREPLLGYPNALETGKYVRPDCGALDLILRAAKDQKRPYFLILDEMNMSHVERYFADFLSAMESADRTIKLHPDSEEWKGCDVPSSVKLPENLFIICTVNIDETTYMFSPKVLDRANVIEFRVTEEEMKDYLDSPKELDMDALSGVGASMAESFVAKAKERGLKDENLKDDLMPFFEYLEKAGAEFGYRTASEMSRFVKICTDLAGEEMTRDEVIDAAIMQKLLPKLHGSRKKLESILEELIKLCANDDGPKYSLSHEKLNRMLRRVRENGFTSYAEA